MLEKVSTIRHQNEKQDCTDIAFFKTLSANVRIFGLFRAHGSNAAARFAKNFIINYLDHNLRKTQADNKIHIMLKRAFVKCQSAMLSHKEADRFVRSGTTALVGVAVGDSLHLACLGDSICEGVSSSKKATTTISLPRHTLADDNEKIRVVESGGWYDCSGDSDVNICNKQVNVTRSLGHLWQIDVLAWYSKNNLRYLNRKSLQENDADVETVMSLFKRKPPIWCISPDPDIIQADIGGFDFLIMSTDAQFGETLKHALLSVPPETSRSGINKLLKNDKSSCPSTTLVLRICQGDQKTTKVINRGSCAST